MRNKAKMGFLAGALTVLLLFGCERREEPLLLEEPEMLQETEDKEVVSAVEVEEEKEKEVTLVVHVCGAVHVPGVYELPFGSRVYQAIEAAGGITSEADLPGLNQAEILEDGQQIIVPVLGQEISTPEGTETKNGKVNINRANAEQLMTLTGIGRTRAEAILAYRESHGSFRKIEDLMKVEGIKEKTWDKIKEEITVK